MTVVFLRLSRQVPGLKLKQTSASVENALIAPKFDG
jgi:hypothetical protein